MQGPQNPLEFSIPNGLISGHPKPNVDPELKSETQRQLRLEILESISEQNDTKYLEVSKKLNEVEYQLNLFKTGNLDVPYRLNIKVVSPISNAVYTTYISKNGEYLQKDLIPEITIATQKRLIGQGIQIIQLPEGYTELDIATGLIDDILLKFW
jgi:hypothetical protein